MTREQAQRLTKLDGREKEGASNEFLKCQLGHYEFKTVKTSAFREMSVPVYKLVAYGSSWENAVEMWERKMKAVEG